VAPSAIPELLSLARTVSRWENEIVAAVLTGITNSVSAKSLQITSHLQPIRRRNLGLR